MKAVQISKFGGSDVLGIVNVSEPFLKDDQILVEVNSASINPFDLYVLSGTAGGKLPLVLGGDFSGIVTKVADGVSDFKIGNEVYGQALVQNGGSGSFAKYCTANVENSSFKPKNISFEEAAALPLVGSSAIQALEEHIKLRRGQKILIHGGAGGIGHIAIQIARALGAYVATTVGTDDVEFAKELGVDEVIDYKTQKFDETLKDFDAVLDTVGESTWEKSFQVLKKGGVFVSMLGQPDPKTAEGKGITSIGQGTDTNLAHLDRVRSYVEEEKVKVHIDKKFPLEQIRQVFDYFQNQSHKGKVVIKIK